MEQTLWLNDGGTRLFAVYHPVTSERPPHAALVFVHPLFEEKKSAHRILVDTARTFAAAGVAVLRFDLAGCGDSQGAMETQSPSIWQDNICVAAQWLAQRIPDAPLGILGLRMGATLALTSRYTMPSIQRLILWEPVVDGAAWLRERLRQRLAREMLASGRASDGTPAATNAAERFLDIDGFRLSFRLVEEVEKVSIVLPKDTGFRGSCLILQIGSASRTSAGLETMASGLNNQNGSAEIRQVRAPPFWNRLEPQPCPQAAATTLDWMGSVSSATATVSALQRRDAGQSSVRPVAPVGPVGEKILTFGEAGHRLCGIWHPAYPPNRRPTKAPAVLFLHGWGAYRIGPHRMFVNAARFLAGQGIPVLRFDFTGRGDSEGITEKATIESMTADACRALAELRDAAPDHRLVVLGMCSGAKIAAAVAAGHVAEVDGVILWSPEPPDEAEQAAGRIKTVRRRSDILRVYCHKLMHPAIWRKAITGGVDWRLVHRALWGSRGPKQSERERDRSVYRAFSDYPRPRLLVFGTADPSAHGARNQYRQLAQKTGAEYAEHGIENADHNFYHADWERAVMEISADWLLNLT